MAAALIAQLQTENGYLRGELTRAHEQLAEERRRADTIMAMLAARPQELAPPATPLSPQSPQEPHQASTAPTGAHQGAVDEAGEGHVPLGAPPPKRPWWRLW